jgi:RND family efflux transporter MFP subunit
MRRLLPVMVAVTVGCQKPATPPAAAGSPAPDAPVAVTVATPKRVTLNWAVEQPGSIQPFETTPLVAKLPGYVKSLRKDLGDPVAAGEVLAEIDIPELEREADQKAAAVLQAAAEVEQARQGVLVAEEQVHAAAAGVAEAKAGFARVEADYARWESELKRTEGLVRQRVIDQQSLDEVRKQFQSAAAGRQELAAKVASAEAARREATARKGRSAADLAAAEARAKVAEADKERVAALLGYRQVRAPFAGFVTGRYVHTGHFLQPGGARPEPLFTVARLDPVRVFVEVPESAAPQANPGTPATVRVPALGGKEFAGSVTRTARVLASDTRTLRTEIDLPNPSGELRPGLYAVARIKATTPDALLVPPAAVLFADETAYCFAVEGGKAVKLRVQVGRTDPAGVQLLAKRRASVNAGDWTPVAGDEKVVVGNLGALADGQAVEAKP